jgi:hypothetical protein
MSKTIVKAFKSVWVGFLAVAEAGGRARAAAELDRNGYHKAAREILLKENK